MRHPCRCIDVALDVAVVVLAGEPLDQDPKDNVAGIAVPAAGARRERLRLRHEELQVVVVVLDVMPVSAGRCVEDVAAQSGLVSHQLPDRCLAGGRVGIVGPVVPQRRVEADLPCRGELPNGRRGEHLVDRPDVELRRHRVGAPGGAVGHAVGLREERLAVATEFDRAGELARCREGIERLPQPRERADPG